jgi:hypothetical protein
MVMALREAEGVEDQVILVVMAGLRARMVVRDSRDPKIGREARALLMGGNLTEMGDQFYILVSQRPTKLCVTC